MTVDHHRVFDSFSRYDTPYPVGVKLPEITVDPKILENLGDVEVGKKRCGIARRGGRNKIFSKCRRKFTLTLEHC